MGCGVVFVVAGAESLPWGPRLWGCDVLAMSGGVPVLLGSLGYMCDEVWELLGFNDVELNCELLLECVICLVQVLGQLAVWHESRCGEVLADLLLVWL